MRRRGICVSRGGLGCGLGALRHAVCADVAHTLQRTVSTYADTSLTRHALTGLALGATAASAAEVALGCESFSFRDRPFDDAIRAMKQLGRTCFVVKVHA